MAWVKFRTRARSRIGKEEAVYVQTEHIHYVVPNCNDRIKGNTVINMGAMSELTVDETLEEVMEIINGMKR